MGMAACLLAAAEIHLRRRGDVALNTDEAKGACDEALVIFKERDDVKGEAMTMHVLAEMRFLTQSSDGALKAAKEAQLLFDRANLRKQTALEIHRVAQWKLIDGEVEEAIEMAEEALDICEDDFKATDAEIAVMQTLVRAKLTNYEGK